MSTYRQAEERRGQSNTAQPDNYECGGTSPPPTTREITMDNEAFDASAWKVSDSSRKNGNQSIPFPLLRKLEIGTTVLRILDAHPVQCYQHLNGEIGRAHV